MSAPEWVKSSYSDSSGGQCVEVAAGSAIVRVRDSKLIAGSVLALPADAWDAFVSGLKRGSADASGRVAG